MPLIFQQGTSSQRSQTLVIGSGLSLDQTADGLAQISTGGGSSSDVLIVPSGSDDTAAIQDAAWDGPLVRLAPGVFTVSATVDVGAGVVISGSGRDKTTVNKTNFDGAAFGFGDDTEYAAVENLHIVGPGKAVTPGNTGVMASRGPAGLPIARGLTLRNLRIEEMSDFGIFLENCADITVESVVLKNIGFNAFYAVGCTSLHAKTVRAEGSGSIELETVSGAVLAACEAEGGWGSFQLQTSSDVVLDGCVSSKCEELPIHISGGSNIVINAFVSNNVGTPYFVDQPHILVENATTGVQIVSFRRVNTDQAGTLTSEANVSGAGGRVLVGYHNFTSAKILSSGKFADISATTRA